MPLKSTAQLDAEIAETLRAHQWQERLAQEELARRKRTLAQVVGPSPSQLYEEHQADVAAGIFHGEKRGRTRDLRRRFRAARQPARETQTRDDHPGLAPPHQGDLSIGRPSEGWKPLYWKRLLTAYIQEAPGREKDTNAIDLDLWIEHAPDDHTPFERLGWPDPRDVRGAERTARQFVEEGRAQFTAVQARARRKHSKQAVNYTLARFARDDHAR